jgi:hypothetical protein
VRRLKGDVFTYAEFGDGEQVLKEGTTNATFGNKSKKSGPTWMSVQDVRESKGYRVRSFEELIKITSHLAAGNRDHHLFFRGQSRDYVDRNGRTLLYPTLYRSPSKAGLKKRELAERWSSLEKLVRTVVAHRSTLKLPGKTHRHVESAIALLQHYGLAPTPLLDVTPSLRVAASFALLPDHEGNAPTSGVLYVLALPYPHGRISHFVDQDTVLVRLVSVCPYEAVRPHHQEGYLVGKFPISDAGAVTVEKERNDNAASRLVAKLLLDDAAGTFFSSGFGRIPTATLMPPKDAFGDLLRSIVAAPTVERKSPNTV